MSRPTIEFRTSGGHTLVLNSYITGAENWDIREIYIRGAKATDTGVIARQAERRALEIVIVSVDGKSENVADNTMKLPLNEYQEVIAEVTPIVEGKKKSETSLPNTRVTAS